LQKDGSNVILEVDVANGLSNQYLKLKKLFPTTPDVIFWRPYPFFKLQGRVLNGLKKV